MTSYSFKSVDENLDRLREILGIYSEVGQESKKLKL